MGLYVDIEKKLKDFTLRVKFDTEGNNGITGILGASGCGKSMTLKSIAGIVTPDCGRIVLNGRVLFDSEKKIHVKVQGRKVGYLFQSYALFPNMTIRDNIEIAVEGSKTERRKTADRYLALMKIQELADSYPNRLSGGQQQRAALARILASKPEVLMLDEPFSALDAYLKEILQIELLDILKNYQGDILMVTHNRDEVYRFCDQIHILDRGQMVASGDTKAVFHNPQAVAAAKLTGCKNIVPAGRKSAHELFVPAWGITMMMEREIPEWLDHIGIRAHYLIPAAAGAAGNIISCRWEKVLEDPFEITAILDNGVWWKVSKEDWKSKYKEQLPECLKLPEESVLFLREEQERELSL